MKTIEVLGLGPTLRYYKPNDNETIGVNDIFAFHRVDHLIVLDSINSFDLLTFLIICNSTPKHFYSSLFEWKSKMVNFTHVQIAPKPGDLSYLDTDYLPIHVDSTFSAACLAYKLGAKRIIMHGVDLKDHLDLKHYWKQGIIQDVYMRLLAELHEREVELFVGSEESPLSEFIPVYENN